MELCVVEDYLPLPCANHMHDEAMGQEFMHDFLVVGTQSRPECE